MINADYKLLHFNFKEMNGSYLISNDAGKFQFLSKKDFIQFTSGSLKNDTELFMKLKENCFLLPNSYDEIQLNEVSDKVRRAKNHLFQATSLHIFVLTNNCNHNCIYCQASANRGTHKLGNMSIDTAEKAVEIALSSPSKDISIEFQGGEPLLNFAVLKHIVDYTTYRGNDKNISLNLVSNLSLLTYDILDFLISRDVSICTSLDGPRELHNLNRPMNKADSYQTTRDNILLINREYKQRGLARKVQALQTTTKNSLSMAEEIIDEYLNLGINHIFIRPLTPLGTAQHNWDDIGYTAEQFITFYAQCLDYIISLRQKNINITEGHLNIFMQKIASNKAINYMELRSPCGAAIGQMAYNYDGRIYTCDEGRMLAECGEDSLMLGDVHQHQYPDLIDNKVTYSMCVASCLECLPGCCDCVYSPLCGACPAVSLIEQNSIMGKMPLSYKCKIYKGMLDQIFLRIANGLLPL